MSPTNERMIREAREAEEKRLAKIKAEDEALARLPRDQRVLKPKSVKRDGKEFLEFDMYGARFRIPREYLGQVPPDGNFVDGYFTWPEKKPFRNTNVPRRDLIKFWIDGFRTPSELAEIIVDGWKTHYTRTTTGATKTAVVGTGATEYLGSGYFILRDKSDVRSPSGDILWLTRRSTSPGDRDKDEYVTRFAYRGVEIAYFFERRLAVDWKEINEELLRLVIEWSKE